MMRPLSNTLMRALAIVILFGILGFVASNAREGSASSLVGQTGQQSSSSNTGQSGAEKYFTDVELTNQDGQKMRLYNDLLKGKVVVINSFFSTCAGSCLPLSRNMGKLQDALGDKVGKDVYLISISVDPMMDTPQRLKEFAHKMGSKPGWFFLAGDKANVDFALKKLGQYVDDKQNHLNIFIIGNERTGLWKKAFGLAKPAELIKVVESVLNDKPAAG